MPVSDLNRTNGAVRAVLTALIVLAGLAAGCGAVAEPSAEQPGTSAPDAAPVSSEPIASVDQRSPLPHGFPVLPGALAVPLPDDDPDLVAAWTTELRGSAAYDFYLQALPAAGYRVEGLYPGGEWAVIRFRLADGAVWQLLVHGTDPVEVEVRVDRP